MLAVSVEKNGEVLVHLTGYDADGDKLEARITSVPDNGAIHQLSQIFSDFGYQPQKGLQIASASSAAPVVVTGSRNRIVYTPPAHTNAPDGKWTLFTYVVSDGTTVSEEGIVWMVPSHQQVVFSDFATSLDGWSITNNGARASALVAGGLTYEPFSRGVLNHYILGTDAEIHTDRVTGDDLSLWYFVAGPQFLGNHIITYGGQLKFAVASAAGDFATNNVHSGAQVVILECDSCASGSGIRLAKYADDSLPLDGRSREVSISLTESAWRKDPKNTLLPWLPPSQCEMVEVLAGLTSLRILGDHTKWYESVALDRVGYTHGSGVPVSCAHIYY
jgi:hypothetical protein